MAGNDLKSIFDEARYRKLADDLSGCSQAFDSQTFLRLALNDLESRELMDRMRRTSVALHAALPLAYAEQLTVLSRLAPRVGHGFTGIFLSDFVAQFGLDDPDRSLAALHEFTRYGSAEFAIRPFILRAPERTLALMHTWTTDPNEHVRRLASEGCRPRLPWGQRLQFLVQNPRPTFPILAALRADTSLYVRKSVANHVNDITKDHPEAALKLVSDWNLDHPHTGWIVGRGLRTLVKQGDPAALKLMGVGGPAKVSARLETKPDMLTLGDEVTLVAYVQSTSPRPQKLIIDYVLHYVRPGRKTSAKVFKWKTITLPPGEAITLTKTQQIRDFSTRKHYAGEHRVDLQINGRILANAGFRLIR